MPSSSAAQHKLMNIASHTPGGYGGVTQSVGRDFINADKRVGRAGGGSLSSYQGYDTPLADSQVADYLNWKQRFAPNDNGSDYDLHGAYAAGISPDPERGHFPDTYKKPNHPTFSDESQYSTPDHRGGTWSTRAGHDVFTPSQFNLSQSPPDQLRAYFDQKEPDAVLDISTTTSRATGGGISNALRLARETARGHLAFGGTYSPPHPSFGERSDASRITSPTAGGVIASEVPGRTDHIPTSVAANSYVIPADVVSGVGEGNTQAGARLMQEWLSTGPYGVPLGKGGGRNTIPSPPAAPRFASGGPAPRAPLKTAHIKNDPSEVPVIVAGGEFLIDPHVIAYHPDLGGLDPSDKNPAHYRKAVNLGHKVLDDWVVLERKKIIKTMSDLAPPKKD